MILDLQQMFKNKPIYLCYSQLNVTVLRMSSSVTTLYVNLWPGSATARTTAVTTRMRTLKSAVRVDTDLSLVPRRLSWLLMSFISMLGSSSQGSSSVLRPELSAAKMIACVCKCRRGVTESTTVATTQMN